MNSLFCDLFVKFMGFAHSIFGVRLSSQDEKTAWDKKGFANGVNVQGVFFPE